jgi:hypothetical protein
METIVLIVFASFLASLFAVGLYTLFELFLLWDRHLKWNSERKPLTCRKSKLIRLYDFKGNTILTIRRGDMAYVYDITSIGPITLEPDGMVEGSSYILAWEPADRPIRTLKQAEEILHRCAA